MNIQNWKRKIFGSTLAVLAIGAFSATSIAAASGGINDAGLETIGITEEAYDAARDEAKAAYNSEMVALGWVTAEEAAEETEEGDWVRVGRGQYYSGILDKGDFIADALGISDAELEAAQDASYDAKIAEKVAEGDLTEAEAADKEAIHDFKDGIDKDAVLAEAMGISVAELDSARASNTSYDDLLDSLGLTNADVRENAQGIMQGLVDDAVANGTLTAEQAEDALSGKRGGRGNGRRGGRGNGNGNPAGAPEVETENASFNTDLGSYDG